MINFIKRVFGIKRYFIVSYKASTLEGTINLVSTDYLNRNNAIEEIKRFSDVTDTLLITNIIEISKHDYNVWVK